MATDTNSTFRRFRSFLVVALLGIGAAACDPEPSRDDHPRASCNLEDEGCASLSELEATSELLESMGVDLETANVELRFPEASEPDDATCRHADLLGLATDAAPGALDRADAADDLTSRPDVQELPPKGGCSFSNGWMCCCIWFGPDAGCSCGPM